MNVLLVSQCTKRALTESRRILDQFAERRGERTWQTAITHDGLITLRKLLRKTARRNTAVACHWIRGKDHSELLWVVGDARQFNSDGAVPTNTTERDVLRSADENNWRSGEDIQLLTQMASLLHDLGKASVAFQERLQGKRTERNAYRHEWVSLRLFQAFVGDAQNDADWLQRLLAPDASFADDWTAKERFIRDDLQPGNKPFRHLPPLAAAIAWLVVTHHRLPAKPVYKKDGSQDWLGKRGLFNRNDLDHALHDIEHHWNEVKSDDAAKIVAPYWQFAHGLPVNEPRWQAQAARLAKRLLALHQRSTDKQWLNDPYIMHLSRLSLMLADHYYSSLPRDAVGERVSFDKNDPLFANTDSQGKGKQTLDEHLRGVAHVAGQITHFLPDFDQHLPRLAKHRGLRKRSEIARFRWQDKAADAAVGLRESSREHGAFIVNMASTGCGKTLANARIVYALADPERGMRATFALGLRTLTLQTGRSYRQDLHLDEDELAILVGGSANRDLFKYYEEQAENSGSASRQDLLDEDSHVFYEGSHGDHPLLRRAFASPKIASMLSAPLLVCTIDHLMPATEAQRGGRQIAPMLRLMSSDLVLDEPDDFGLEDLPALTRLVHWAGLLGTRVVLSSATLPPSLIEGLFNAYRAGRAHFQRNRGEREGEALAIPCLWVDEFATHHAECGELDSFHTAHKHFVDQRLQALENDLKQKGSCRKGALLPIKLEASNKQGFYQAFVEPLRAAIEQAHGAHHETCPITGKRVSFGLVRMANIEPIFHVARALLEQGAPANVRIHLCVYHSRFPLVVRSAIENLLDGALNRRTPEAVYQREDVQRCLAQGDEKDHIFVVLGSPVTEVGRDHDYDWAVVEPSSMRSLIQLAGRVQRHRQKRAATPNILIFDTNLRHFTNLGNRRAAFVYPGFENAQEQDYRAPFRLMSQRLEKLLNEDDYQHISARSRVEYRPCDQAQAKRSLIDLEHARLQSQFALNEKDLNAAHAWQNPQAMLTWVLPQQQAFRDTHEREAQLVFLPNDDEDDLVAHRLHEHGKGRKPDLYVTAENQLSRIRLEAADNIGFWKAFDLLALIEQQAEAQHLSLKRSAEKFSVVQVRRNDAGWEYHPVLGFALRK